MRIGVLIICLVLTACGGSLSDEQRKKLKEGMELNTIRKVSEAQVTEAAFNMGRTLSGVIQKSSVRNQVLVDSLQRAYKVRIAILQPANQLLMSVEKQIVDAYSAGADTVQLSDNIQRSGPDTLLYTLPVLKKAPDGNLQFDYALGIYLPRRQVVLSIKEE